MTRSGRRATRVGSQGESVRGEGEAKNMGEGWGLDEIKPNGGGEGQ